MRFHYETFDKQKARLGQWHRWFAWFPVDIALGTTVWLETVERRMEYQTCYADSGWEKEYREIGGDWSAP
jgi:hypothetical protein